MRKQEVTALPDEQAASAGKILFFIGEPCEFARGLFAPVIPKSFDGVADGPLGSRVEIFVGCPCRPVFLIGGLAGGPIVGHARGFDASRGG